MSGSNDNSNNSHGDVDLSAIDTEALKTRLSELRRYL